MFKINKPPINVDSNDWSFKKWFSDVYNILKNFIINSNGSSSWFGGNLGLNGTPNTASTNYVELMIGPSSTILADKALVAVGSLNLSQNAEFTNNAWKRISTGLASSVAPNNGQIDFRTAVTGAAGSVISWNTGLTITGTQVFSASTIVGRDLYAARSATEGVIFFGSNGLRYLYYDTIRYFFPSANLALDGFIGVGIGETTPLGYIDAKQATNQHFVVPTGTPVAMIGACNDGFSAWIDLNIGGNCNLIPQVDNTISCGKTGNRWSTIWAANGVIQTSDARQKQNITTSVLGLDFINNLHPVSYQWIEGGNIVNRVQDTIEEEPETIGVDGTVIPAKQVIKYKDEITPVVGKRTHWGLLAQEVKQVTDAAGVDFGGYIKVNPNDPTSEEGLRYDQFIAPLIKAVQELTARVKVLEAK